MKRPNKSTDATKGDDTTIDLPLVNISKQDVLGALLVHTDTTDEMFRDALLKLQTWIINFTEEQIAPLRDSGCFTEEELEQIKKRTCVVSPMTLTLYLHWLQMDIFSKLPDSEKEKRLLEKLPDRFKARYKGNAACRNAREPTTEEEPEDGNVANSAEGKDALVHMSFDEFLKKFGTIVKSGKKEG